MPIPKALYAQVRQRAKFRCEYCHYPEVLSAAPLSIDHLQPQSLGGSDDTDNLALACRRCNERRYNFINGIDPQTDKLAPLFNPRRQNLPCTHIKIMYYVPLGLQFWLPCTHK